MKKSEYFTTELLTSAEAVEIMALVPDTCLSKAADDEIIFVLRAKDPLAADIVEIWATLAPKHHEFEKVQRAQKCARDMRMWHLEYLERELGL